MYVWKKVISKFRWHCISVCSLVFQTELPDAHYANMVMQYAAIFEGCKNDNFDEKMLYQSYFCSKHRLWVLVRTASLRQF